MASQILIIENFGREIKIMRKHEDWTQQEYADKCGLHLNTVLQVENEKQIPEIGTMHKLLAPFGLKYEVQIALIDREKLLTTEIKKKKKRF